MTDTPTAEQRAEVDSFRRQLAAQVAMLQRVQSGPSADAFGKLSDRLDGMCDALLALYVALSTVEAERDRLRERLSRLT